jgi:hypothetical protein
MDPQQVEFPRQIRGDRLLDHAYPQQSAPVLGRRPRQVAEAVTFSLVINFRLNLWSYTVHRTDPDRRFTETGAVAEAFGAAVVGSGECDGRLVAGLFGGTEGDAGRCVPSDARVRYAWL